MGLLLSFLALFSGGFQHDGARLERDGFRRTDVHAFGTVYALVIADAFDVHLAMACAKAAARALVRVDLYADQIDPREHAVDRAQRAQETAEAAEHEDRRADEERQYDEFARKEYVEHRELLGVGGVGHQPDRALKCAGRADELAKARHGQMLQRVIERNGDDEHDQYHVLHIGERVRDAVLLHLGRRDLVEQLLHEAHRTDPAADRAP